ncbi:MAG: translocation/assembly module TamB domain-containing protein [Flavobacteriaceae bacterium]
MKALKTLFYYFKRLLVLLLILFVILIVAFSIPSVQTYFAKKLTTSVNASYGTDIQIEKFRLGYNGRFQLKKVFIKDHKEDTLIYANKLSSSLLDLFNFNFNHLDFSTTEADSLVFKLTQYKGEESSNLDYFIDKLDDTTSTSENSTIIEFERILMTDSRFLITNENLENPEALELNYLNLNVSDLLIDGSNVTANLKRLSSVMGRGIVIEDMQTQFSYTPEEMQVKNLHLLTSNSSVEADIRMRYAVEDLADFENKVAIQAQIHSSDVSSSDLRRFYDKFGYGHNLHVQGELNGSLNDFRLTHFSMDGLTGTKYRGQIDLRNSFATENGFRVEANHTTFQSNRQDLIALLPPLLNENLPEFLQEFQSVDLNGQTIYDNDNLSLDFNAKNKYGELRVDVDFQSISDPEEVRYQGSLGLIQFDLSPILKTELVNKVSLSAFVDGKGFTQESLNTRVNAKISSININEYNYRDIEVVGDLKAPIFDGKMTSLDENFEFDFNGLIDASRRQNTYDFDLVIHKADLNEMNLVKRSEDSDFSGKIKVDLKGNTIDEAVGELRFIDFVYQEGEAETYKFDTLTLRSFNKDRKKIITVKSPDIVDGEISGEFKITSLPQLFGDAIQNLYFREDDYNQNNYQYLDFNFKIYNKVVEVFFPDIRLSADTYLNGSLVADQNEFKLNFKTPLVEAFGNRLEKVNLQIDNKNPLYNSFVKVDSLSTSFYNISDFSMINVTLNDTLYMRSEFKGGKNNSDKFNLSLYQTLTDDNKSVFGFKRSSLKFKDKLWWINKENNRNNRIIVERGFQNFEFDSISMKNRDQVVDLQGVMRDSTYKNVNLNFKKVDLANVTPYVDSLRLAGEINGKVQILQENKLYKPNLDIKIDEFKLNDFDYGQLSLEADGNRDLNAFSVFAKLLKEDTYLFDIGGTIKNTKQRQVADLDISFKDFDIQAFSPLGGDVIDRMRGTLYGDAKLTGDLLSPDLDGEVQLYKAGLGVPYLNVDYDFAHDALIKFDKKEIVLKDINIKDTKYETKGVLSGNITHNTLSDWELDLDVSSDNLVVLDTEFERGSIYYGTAFIDGSAEIYGPIDELNIDVNAKTMPDTVFKIPLDDTESVADNSFIYFLSAEEKASQLAGNQVHIKDVTGLKLNFELDITRDAEVEIVVDQSTGSRLNGRGAGTILIEINTNGRFNMWGDFVAYEGYYDFKYAGNLVQKRFELVPGSNLTWNGDPVQANMDVQAKYTTSANPAVILENPSINREIPVEVITNLRGQLIQPDISFELNYPNLSSVVKSELEYRIQGDDTEYQALSLITQGSFYSQQLIGQNALTGNLIESASGIFDDIISSDDSKFKLGLDYVQSQRTPTQDQTGDRVGFTFQTQLSKRIYVNSRFGVPVGGTTESVVFGDVEISFLLNKKGNLRATAFNRESDIQFIGEDLGYTQGVGISYTVNFESFKELVQKIFDENYKAKTTRREEEVEAEKEIEIPSYIKFPRSTRSRTVKE